MESDEIKIGDWSRILEGLTPPQFLLEVVIRMLFAYGLLLVSVRFMGNRMASDLSKVDMITRVSLAAAIGMPLQAPDRGLLPSVVVILVAVCMERIISAMAVRSRRFELLTQDNYDILLFDSVLDIGKLRKTKVTRERLFAHLRAEGYKHLGEIKRVFFEASGSFTIIENKTPQPGLSILPDWDVAFRSRQKQHASQVCKQCGKQRQDTDRKCPSCQSELWEQAVDPQA